MFLQIQSGCHEFLKNCNIFPEKGAGGGSKAGNSSISETTGFPKACAVMHCEHREPAGRRLQLASFWRFLLLLGLIIWFGKRAWISLQQCICQLLKKVKLRTHPLFAQSLKLRPTESQTRILNAGFSLFKSWFTLAPAGT